jgi:MFS family permease
MNRDLKLITFALFLWGCGEGLFLYIQPYYMQQLGATPAEIGAVLGLASFLTACAFIPGGMLADRFDAKQVMVWGWAMGVVGALGMGLSSTWQWFVPWILLYNVSAYCIPAINTYIAEASGDTPLEHTITVTFAGYAAGSIISPFVGGRLAEMLGTATLYLIGAALFGLSLIIALRVSSHAPHLNYPKHREQSLRQQMARLRPLLPLYARLFVVFFAGLLGAILPANFLGVLGWSIGDVNSLAGTAGAVGALVLSLALGRLAAGHRRRGLLIGQGLVWGGLWLFTISTPQLRLLPIAAYFLLGALPALRELANAQVAAQVDRAARGTALGMNETLFALARSLAAVLAGVLFAIAPRAPFIAGLALIPIGWWLVARLRAPQPRTPAPPEHFVALASASNVIIEAVEE